MKYAKLLACKYVKKMVQLEKNRQTLTKIFFTISTYVQIFLKNNLLLVNGCPQIWRITIVLPHIPNKIFFYLSIAAKKPNPFTYQ